MKKGSFRMLAYDLKQATRLEGPCAVDIVPDERGQPILVLRRLVPR